MDKKDTKPHKSLDTHSPIDEENLWDLEDDWDMDESSDKTEETPEEKTSTPKDQVTDKPEKKKDEEKKKPKPPKKKAPPLSKVSPGGDNEFNLEGEDLDEEPKPLDEDNAPPKEDQIDQEEEKTTPPAKEKENNDEVAPNIGELSAPLKKISLTSTEKISLAALTILFAGLAIWGYIYLLQKNNLAEASDTLELPVKGDYATVSEFSTFWIIPDKSTGIKLGAAVVPAASITLSDASSSGALRVYFRNTENDSVGDTITLSFQDGKFKNGTNTIEFSSSDGFHMKGEFHAYQMDTNLAWTVHVLEATTSSSTGSDYTPLFTTKVDPKMR